MWVTEHRYEILGDRFTVQSDNQDIGDRFARLLAPFEIEAGAEIPDSGQELVLFHKEESWEGQEVATYWDRKCVSRNGSWSPVVNATISEINRAAIDACANFAVHAGAVALNGHTIVFPAESGQGKTTLSAACLKTGFEYVSDEALVAGDNGDVILYPKPLALSDWSLEALGVDREKLAFPAEKETLATAEDLNSKVASAKNGAGLTVSHVVMPERGHDTMELEEVAQSEAMATLLKLSFNHYKIAATIFKRAAQVANGAQAWRLRYSDPLAAADLLRERLAA